MESSRYLALLDQDAARVAEIAQTGLGAPVPACPGWTVQDVVEHLAYVYLHKVECIRQQAAPDPWPPDLSGREPLALFREAYDTLAALLRAEGPEARSYTWYPADQTVGFWYRRMAQETAVHRIDVEEAHGDPTPIDPELAADGIDELLIVMVAGDWSDEPVEDADGKIAELTAGRRRWRVSLGRERVDVVELSAGTPDRAAQPDAAKPDAAQPDAAKPDVSLRGEPGDVLLWAWGRLPEDQLEDRFEVDGDREVLAALRRRFAMATQ